MQYGEVIFSMKWKWIHSTILLVIVLTLTLEAQTVKTIIDLNDENSKFIDIQLQIPSVDVDKLNYSFLAGDFNRNDVFNYISNIEILDSLEKKIAYLIWENRYVIIKEAEKVHTINYKVEKKKLTFLNNGFHPSQFLIKDKCYYFYPFYFIGYFDQYPEWSYEIEIVYPENLSTPDANNENQSSKIALQDFNDFFNFPLLVADFDTASFTNQNIDINLTLFQEERKLHINQIKQIVLPIVKDFKLALDSLALSKYNLSFCFLEDEKEQINFGGLFHGNNNLFLFPSKKKFLFLIPVIQKTVAHELMHTLSPLHLHSNQHNENSFFTTNKKFSQHQWLYEGVTDYLSIQLLSKNKRISERQVFKEWAKKIRFDERLGAHSLTKISKNILKPKNRRYQKTFYNKGFIVALLMDIALKENSQNKFSLFDLMISLAKEYGKDKPFDEDALLTDLSKKYPELKSIIENYITGSEDLPIPELFSKLGIQFDSWQIVSIPDPTNAQVEIRESVIK